MKRKPASLNPEDSQLFRDTIGAVRRIETPIDANRRPAPKPEPRRLLLDEAEALEQSQHLSAAVLADDGGELQSYRRPDLSERMFKQLKKGQFSVQDEIDLHNLRAAEAESILKRFLTQAATDTSQCVRIIHGKGLRSEGAPVLKMLVERVLRHRGDVLAFASAPPKQGGTGAVLVLLGRLAKR